MTFRMMNRRAILAALVAAPLGPPAKVLPPPGTVWVGFRTGTPDADRVGPWVANFQQAARENAARVYGVPLDQVVWLDRWPEEV